MGGRKQIMNLPIRLHGNGNDYGQEPTQIRKLQPHNINSNSVSNLRP